MKKFIVVAWVSALMVILPSCGVNHSQGERALKSMGYTNIKIGGYSWWGCSDSDNYASTFTATGVDGTIVTGSLCSGLFKSMTVRLD